MKELTAFTDYFVIASGESTTQVRAVAGHIEETLLKGAPEVKKQRPLGMEGLGSCTWVLMDYSDVIMHVFEEDTREYYKLEKLWLDAPRIKIDEAEDTLGRKDKGAVHR